MTRLDVFSDPVCPWCYIGKTLLDRAEAAHGAAVFEREWHPFLLNPDMPRGGMDRQSYISAKFGGQEKAREVYGRIAEAASAAGLSIDFAAIPRTPNTIDAQRLIFWSGVEGHQEAVVAALFRAYFDEGRDLEDPDTLADIADGCGLDAAVIRRLLATDVDQEEIGKRHAAASELGVTSVPTFIVAGQHAVPGAQPEALWLEVLAELDGAVPARPISQPHRKSFPGG